ncbi:MAG TPA: UvrD-helicase domain-containing protein, partial [Rickettsiales bacterium]|nr:UvrD-helicase domain-containing protein [Rickettsiales bacterium]
MFRNLNEPQILAVKETQGPLLVLAGAGTGKTKVLTSRIIHILNSQLATPLQILAVTFTNKAAAEMRHRIGDMIGDAVNGLWIGTFHAIAAKIVRRHAEIVGLKSDFTIIDQDDQTRLIKQILGDLNIDTKQFPAKNYLNKISRNKDIKIPDFNAKNNNDFDDNSYDLPKLASVFRIYQNRLKSMNAADFGDLLIYNLEIFHKNPEVLVYYQDKFRYVLVDEYQDTNNVQYSWLLKLADAHKNLCAVGDDDQSIYSWRGANIANILRFEKDFKNAKVIRLEQNYRSTSQILKVADSVISKNSNRHGKTLWTDKKDGQEVKLHSFVDDRGEARFVSDIIDKYLQQKKYKASQVAILVRAGYQTRTFEEAFIKTSIPYRIVGGMKFYERMEVKDAICYLRVVCNFDDDLALSRIINTPKRGVGETSMSALYEKANLRQISLWRAIKEALDGGELKGKAKESLRELFAQIEKWRKALESVTLSEIARMILQESGYIKMWQAENSLEAQGRLENIDEFIGSLGDFENITEFLEYVSLVEVKDDKTATDVVNVMTIHAAKGLEFDLVFIVGLEDGIFPSSRSVEERDGLEE